MNRLVLLSALAIAIGCPSAGAEVVEYPGSPAALPHQRFVHVVSEAESPVQQTYVMANDGLSVVEHVRRLPYVDQSRISLYGVSPGGNLVMYLASKTPGLRAVVDFVLGPQGQDSPDLPAGEMLLQGALDRAVRFVESGKLPATARQSDR